MMSEGRHVPHQRVPRRSGVPAKVGLWQSLPVLLLTVMRVVPGPSALIAYLALPLYALRRTRNAILALFLVWLFNTMSHGFGRPPGWTAATRHLAIFGAAFSVLVLHVGARPRSRCPMLIMATGGLCLILLLHSILISTAPDISGLKALSFSLTLLALLVGWSKLNANDDELARRQIFGVLIGIALASIPLVGMGIGYMRNGRGFQGVLVHPQAFGPTMAILATWLFARWLTRSLPPLLGYTALPLALVWVYLSQARIAALMFLAGALMTVSVGPVTAALNRWRRFPRVNRGRLAFLTIAVVIGMVLGGPLLAGRFTDFLQKGRQATTLGETVEQSRGGLLAEMYPNIREHPLTGIGLGVPSDGDLEGPFVVRDPVFGIVLMAPVEKGVLAVAMVEEFGWPLAILWFGWFAAVQAMACRAGVVNAALCAAALASNIAEAAFFSPGGVGMVTLVIVTMTATAPAAHLTARAATPAKTIRRDRSDGLRLAYARPA